MSNNFQSIEDLIADSQGHKIHQDDEGNTQTKLREKEHEIKLKELERVTANRAAQLNLPYINLLGFPISPEAVSQMPESEAMAINSICFFYDGTEFRVATTKPGLKVLEKLKELKEKLHANGVLYLTSENSFAHAMEKYKAIPKVRAFETGYKIEESDLDKYSEKFSTFKDLQQEIDKAQITEIVTVVLASSIKAGSSDIHIESEEEDIKVRFRIDGILHNVANINKDLWKKIISRMKVLAKVKINISDKPQDGRMTLLTKKERIDIRVSFLPTNYGESVVMRLLRSSSVGLAFESLGIRGKAFEQLKHEIERPNGMIITTGPTGSGKTTTLYAVLRKLNNPETKIITVEDPIEYQLEGINQSQVSVSYTFAKALRSIVRQDPDVLMVGEIRDTETAEISIQAALTGHLVLSTIHTNDAAGAIPRFLSMGSKPFLLAPAINAVIGQRLVRRVCEKCKEEDEIDEEHLARARGILKKVPEEYLQKVDFNNLKFYKGRATNCEYCQGIGYKGRIGIYEIFTMNKEIESLILSGVAGENDIRDQAIKNGMITMVQDGLLKALEGVTSFWEVFRVAEEKDR